MPSNQQMAEWSIDHKKAPKKVRNHLPQFKQGDSTGGTAAPEPRPLTSHEGGGVAGHPAWLGQGLDKHDEQPKRETGEDIVKAGLTMRMDGPLQMFPSFGWRSQDEADKENEKNAVERELQLGRTNRADVLGMSTGAMVSTIPDLKEMTEERYNSLTPRQRAAVDFNTSLSTVVRRDKHHQDEYKANMTEQQKATYASSVKDMFGDSGGSETIAPETVSLLHQLFKGQSLPEADLDQYLNLDVALTGKDIKHLNNVTDMTAEQLVPFGKDKPETRTQIQGELVDATLDVQQYLEHGDKLIQNFQQSAALDRLEDLQFLGADAGHKAPMGRPSAGFGGSEMDSWFKSSANTLFDKRSASERPQLLDEMLAKVRENGADPQTFLNYLDERLKNSEWYGEKVGTDPKGKYPDAEKIRTALGLEE